MAETPSHGLHLARMPATAMLLALAGASACAERPESRAAAPVAAIDPVKLVACQPQRATSEMQCGVATVPENRAQPGGRALRLAIIVVPSRSATPDTLPVYFIAGGPGQTVTEMAPLFERSRYRDDRAIV